MNRFLLSCMLLFQCFSLYSIGQTPRTVHVFVALCDNKNQGIVPVPEKIGNGQDPASNLYWGAAYGVKTYFRNSSDWTLLRTIQNPKTNILERLIFRHKRSGTYLLADAYDGAAIKPCTIAMLQALHGNEPERIIIDSVTVTFGGNADLIAYVGHDGLMNFSVNVPMKQNPKRTTTPMAVILACISKQFFQADVKHSGAYPLLWSTGLMSPEAYTLKALLDGWIAKESNDNIRNRAAGAYHKFQRCGLKAAKALLVTGW